MLERLIQRAGVADREDVGRGFPARPGDLAVLLDGQADLDLEGRLDAGADDLAVTLNRVTRRAGMTNVSSSGTPSWFGRRTSVMARRP